MAHSHHASGTRHFQICTRAVGLAKSSLIILCLAFTSVPPATAEVATAICQLTASVAGSGVTRRIGSFQVTGQFYVLRDGSPVRQTLYQGVTTCYRDAIRSTSVPPSCTRRHNYSGYEWSQVHGWTWSGTGLKQAANGLCGGSDATKQVNVSLTCSQGLAGPVQILTTHCPGRPAPGPLPNLPPPPPAQQQQQQQQLSLVCQGGAVVNGECRCVPGSRPQLFGPRAYRCVRGPR